MVITIYEDDVLCREALSILLKHQTNRNMSILIASLHNHYPYIVCRDYDLIVSMTTNTDHIECKDIPLLSLRGETNFLQEIYATAEHTWALILSLIRKVPFAHNHVCAGNWNRDMWQGTELYGKALGIIGYGRVGRQVAKIAHAYLMKVFVFDRETHNTLDLEDVLRLSDIITVHLEANDDTKDMFGEAQFDMMRQTAYFINTSRGSIVNEAALFTALEKKKIAGAALDVLCGEPCPFEGEKEGLLHQMEKVNNKLIITPHIAGNTIESRYKTQIFMANKVVEYLERSE